MPITEDDKTMGMLAHLLGIFSSFIGPLIIYLVAKDRKFVKENAAHALNFQISLMIYYIAAVALIFTIIGIVITIIVFFALPIFALIVQIIGTVKAHDGEVYKYPLEIPFLH